MVGADVERTLASVQATDIPVVVDRIALDGDGAIERIVVESANRAATALFHSTAAQPLPSPGTLIDVDVRDLLPAPLGQAAYDATERTFHQGLATGEWRLEYEGRVQRVRYTQYLLPPDRVITFFEDMTPLDHAVADLGAARADLDLALAQSADGLLVLRRRSGDGGLATYERLLTNDAAAALIPSLTMTEFVSRRDVDLRSILDLVDRSLTTGRRATGFRRSAKSSGDRTLSVTVEPIEKDRVAVTIRDVTESLSLRQRATEAADDLERRRRLMVRTFDSIPSPIAVFSIVPGAGRPQFRLQLRNTAAASVESERDEALGQTVDEVYPWAQAAGLRELLDSTVNANDVQRVTLAPVTFRGSERTFDALAAQVEDDTVLLILLDTTELRTALDDLVAANEAVVTESRARASLVETIAHELRTPLTTVVAAADLLLDTRLSAEQRTLVSQQLSASRLLLALVPDTLDLGQVEAHQVQSEAVPLRVAEVFDQVVATLGPMARAAGLTLTFACSDDVPERVMGDPTRLEQVLVNLVANALKFTPEGGVDVTASVHESSEEHLLLRFDVVDTGAGMTPQQLEQIFEPFHQAESSTRRNFGGSGLGLSITRRLVEQLGGAVFVESAIGVGSQFTFTLPARRITTDDSDILGSASDSALDHAQADVSGLRVLLAEDNEVNRIFVGALLAKLGVDADTASDGIEVVDATLTRDYDLILMDVKMPNLDGLEATAHVRRAEMESGHRTRIVALTASPTAETRAEAAAVGMDAVLGKPVDIAALAELLQNVAAQT